MTVQDLIDSLEAAIEQELDPATEVALFDQSTGKWSPVEGIELDTDLGFVTIE